MDELKEVLQQQFNKVYIHLMTQGKRSVSEDGKYCRYRGDDGLMCAAGIMIPDEKYTPDMECIPWICICESSKEAEGWLDKDLGHQLQNIHDRFPVYEWDSHLKNLATRLGLEVPTKDEDGNWRTV